PLESSLVDLRRSVTRKEDQDRVVALRRARQERPERPFDVAERRLPFGLVGQEQDVLLLEAAWPGDCAVEHLGVVHGIAQLRDVLVLVITHTDHDGHRFGTAAAGGAGASWTTGLRYVTVCSTCRAVPSGSVALTRIRFLPSRSVTGTVIVIAFCRAVVTAARGVTAWSRRPAGASGSAVSTPFTLTLTRSIPLLDATLAATTVVASLSVAPSLGKRTTTVSGTGFSYSTVRIS